MASWAAASHEGYRQVEDGYRADRSARLPAPAPGSLPGRTAATVVLPGLLAPGVPSGQGQQAGEGTWAGMSISRRIATLFRVKANKALDRAEDPREVLDYYYEQQLEMVQKVRRGLADVATSCRRVELQLTQLQLSAGKLQGQAQQALAAGREDLAREALIRRAAVTSQISDL